MLDEARQYYTSIKIVLGASVGFLATVNLFFPGVAAPALLQPAVGISLIAVIISCHFWIQRRLVIHYPHAALLFTAFAMLPGAFTAGPNEYAQGKPFRLLYMVVLAWCVGEVLRDHDTLRGYCLSILAIAAVLAISIALKGETLQYHGRRSVWGMNPIGLGRTLGYGTIVAIMLSFTAQRRRLLWWAVALVFTLAMISTGSRGPVLATTIGVIAGGTIFSSDLRAKWRTLALILVVTVGGSLLLTRNDGILEERVTSTGDTSRPTLWRISLEAFLESPMGIGFGNLYYSLPPGMSFGTGFEQYSHNFLIESFVEGGLLFGISLTCLAVISIMSIRRVRGARYSSVLGALLVASLVNASFSSDLVGNRFMWVSIGVALFYSQYVLAARVKKSPDGRKGRLDGGPCNSLRRG